MKTKTIEVWVPPTVRGNDFREFAVLKGEVNIPKRYISATLTYEIEEPKIEITPSELREAFNKHYMTEYGNYADVEKELFGELDE